ncbi:formimidoylglutamate deiminase [Marinomonas sp. THO17]|uniref:formimidoylglutamate deiminase n=1 Tax=Marinomonas sp. THO17 TaxID=3149048 RepID=UPI00336BB4B6
MNINKQRQIFFAKQAWLATGWQENVLFHVENGMITELAINQMATADSLVLSGPVLPSMPNLHSHAFQRVMAGMAEVSLNPNDSFWSWRDLMYKVVQKLTPEDVRIIATQLYIDLLKAGYTQIAEFHYLHHQVGGKPYQDTAEMSHQMIQAANDAGIGITLLPVLYSHSGFGGQAANNGQARFIHSTEDYLQLFASCEQALQDQPLHKLGVCFHSLRAVTKVQIETVLDAIKSACPIHIHIAEQQKEVRDCLAWSSQRPVQWLHNEIGFDARWCLVHATHLDSQEIQTIAQQKAVAGLCPTTEANLGDGIFPATEFEQANGRWGIGSDSHVSLSLVEELRTLEYSQRLRDQQRNRLHRPSQARIGDNLYQQALLGGNQACQVSIGLQEHHRADFIVLDENAPFVAASQAKDLLNRWLFACNDNLIKDVYVAGNAVIKDFHHAEEEQHKADFIKVVKKVMYDS